MNDVLCAGVIMFFVLCFKQKTAYEMRISDWSSDVCASDLNGQKLHVIPATDAFCRFGKVRIGVGDFVMEMGQALPPHAVSAAFGKYISALQIVVPIDLHENAPCLKNTHSLI